MRTALLLCLALPLAACGPTLAQRETAARPAIEALRAARFDDARTKAGEVLKADAANPYASLVDAVARYRNVMHDLMTDLPSILIGAVVGRGFNDRYLRFALENAEKELRVVDASLERAARFPELTFELCLACWEVDWNRNGRVDKRDRAFLEIELDASGKELPEGDPRRRPTFKFDHGDVLWARAFVSFQRAALDVVLAYGYADLDRVIPEIMRHKKGALRLKLEHPERMKEARALVLRGLDFADQARVAYLAETDDDREWLPSPRQESHPLPLPVDEALYQTWKDVVGDLRRIVSREEGLSVAELAQLGHHKWPQPPSGYLDLGGMLERPKDIVIDLGQLAERDRENVGMTEAALKDVFGDYYRGDMKASPLVGRLQRMKAEVDRGHESFERKMRYLFWLN
ncbi:MAG: hypothetical protein HY906_26875 [Deltaproteobacteria bacterium]|nr:hypothetical protein [Deltaproteobacteria bacterium]